MGKIYQLKSEDELTVERKDELDRHMVEIYDVLNKQKMPFGMGVSTLASCLTSTLVHGLKENHLEIDDAMTLMRGMVDAMATAMGISSKEMRGDDGD